MCVVRFMATLLFFFVEGAMANGRFDFVTHQKQTKRLDSFALRVCFMFMWKVLKMIREIDSERERASVQSNEFGVECFVLLLSFCVEIKNCSFWGHPPTVRFFIYISSALNNVVCARGLMKFGLRLLSSQSTISCFSVFMFHLDLFAIALSSSCSCSLYLFVSLSCSCPISFFPLTS